MFLVLIFVLPFLHGFQFINKIHRYQSHFSKLRVSELFDPSWYKFSGCNVKLPTYDKIPKALVHVIGGFLVGSVSTIAYARLLNILADEGFLIVATDIAFITTNHDKITDDISNKFKECYYNDLPSLLSTKVLAALPVIGLSHSLGGKITVLLSSNKENRKKLPLREANIFIAFNNFKLKDSKTANNMVIPEEAKDILRWFESNNFASDIKSKASSAVYNMIDSALDKSGLRDVVDAKESDFGTKSSAVLEEASDLLGTMIQSFGIRAKDAVTTQIDRAKAASADSGFDIDATEWTPSPDETYNRLVGGYNVQANYIIKFDNDDLDESETLKYWLKQRGCDVFAKQLVGNHMSPVDNLDKSLSDELVKILEKISMDAWATRNYSDGMNDEIEMKLRKRLQLPPSTFNWDDDNV